MMKKHYLFFLRQQPLRFILNRCFQTFVFCLVQAAVSAQSSDTLLPVADAFIRDGSYAAINYGSDSTLVVKDAVSLSYTRISYLKFAMPDTISNVGSARLRIFGRNSEDTTLVNISSYGVDNDTWTESGITFNNAPAATTSALSSAGISDQARYYDFDVTDYVNAQLAGDKVVSFLLRDPSNKNKNLIFNSKESLQNLPQLIFGPPVPSNAQLFVENLDNFPSNDRFVFSRIQVPFSRDSINFNANHDSLTVRIRNNGINNLTIKNLILSNDTSWRFEKLKGTPYVSDSSLPLTISPGTFADLTIKFVAADAGNRIKIFYDSLTIVSNDDKFPSKTVYLNGLWQKEGESTSEPYAQEIINVFGFKTKTGFVYTDPNSGDSTKLKGDEILPSYFVRADTTRPVSIKQMAAYHACCTFTEKIMWYAKGTDSLTTVFTQIARDGQTLMPRKGTPHTPASGTINPTTPFGFKVGSQVYTDASKNPNGKIGIRVWKVFDANSNIIPYSYILSLDYLGTEVTNYDYQDNMYFVSNVKPERGAAYSSALNPAPSDIDFGEKLLLSNSSFELKLSSLGKIYPDGSQDPALTISSIAITGENKSEFAAAMPAKTTLNPQDSTTLTVNFNPLTQGLKIADLLIYYNNSLSPLRVPLYGIARAADTTVMVNYRINSGSSTPITINGQTWAADNQYSYDNLEPYTNSQLNQIAGTDEDSLYLKEQSSNADKKPFRYEFPVENGNYVVRLHFAEIYWGAPGSGINGGTGSRVMNVALENQLRIVNFDVTQEVGGATALVKNVPVTVTDGKLNIDFSANVNRPMVVAVEVYSFRATSVLSSEDPIQNVLPEGNRLKKPKVYPNPLQKRFKIEFPGTYSGNSVLQILDAVGRKYDLGKVRLERGSTNNVEVNISHLSLKPGIYYLQILSETRPAEVIKLIIK